MHTQKTITKSNLFNAIVLMIVASGLFLLSSGMAFANVSAADDPCKDPKAVNPECVKTQPIRLTDEQAQKAGLVPKSANNIVAQTLNGVYTVVAIVATITIVLAGIRFITADGDESKITAARKTVYYAVIGLAVVGSAFIITGIIQGVGTK